jgi:hypothetical protein
MPTAKGLKYVKHRLSSAHTLQALRNVWDTIGADYKRDESVQKLKDELKEALKDG